VLTGLGPELHDLGVALGILDAAGELRAEWFANPLAQAGGVFRDRGRRDALRDLIGTLLPADPTAPTASTTPPDPNVQTESWHPLTGPGAAHQVFLTLRRVAGGGLALGLAVRVGGVAVPGVTVTFALGLVEAADDGLHAIVGAPGSPVRARIDVTVDPSGASRASRSTPR